MATQKSPNWLRYFSTKRYAWICFGVLLLTSLVWSINGASLQQSNADQLVGPQLFQKDNLQNSVFPNAHTFLIKWPAFWLINIFGTTHTVFVFFTVLMSLLTVAALAYTIHRIEKRPEVAGTTFLALASILLLVPAQPYAGGLLPVNMAMLATRNIEYVIYGASLFAFIKWPTVRNWRFWAGAALLGLVVASDKLFLAISLGGSLMALAVYALANKTKLVSLSAHWLVGSLAAGIISWIVLSLIKASRLTHISSTSDSPYNLVDGPHGFLLGIFYTVSDFITNFGANPAFDATEVRHIPSSLVKGLWHPGGPGFIINILLLGIGLVLAWRLAYPTLRKQSKNNSSDWPSNLSILLLWSTIAAAGLFVFSDHYYAVDARYLSISLFAVFIAASAALRKYRFKPIVLARFSGIIMFGIVFGLLGSANITNHQSSALKETNDKNTLVSKALDKHKSAYLVGDYWRAVPIKQASQNKQAIVPLQDCVSPRDVLTSTQKTNLNNQSFAYLLSLKKGLTDYPGCSLDEVIQKYGRPNSSLLISGSLSKPDEQLLFYDGGIHKPSPSKPLTKVPQTVVPVPPEDLPGTNCEGPTIMNIVAHEDDDLLFMNPDLVQDIKAGHCVRTIYLTAGDSGHDRFYWLGREQGSQAAYSSMMGADDIWVQRITKLTSHAYATVANLRGLPNVSIIYLHLPDGGTKGEGFGSSNYETLAALNNGRIPAIHSVDKQSSYSEAELVAALATFMHLYNPAEVRSQADYTRTSYPDHSDHIAAGSLAQKAHLLYERQQFEGRVEIPMNFYVGYPIHGMPDNISDGELAAKAAAFKEYIKHDGGACKDINACLANPAYGSYLKRQYKFTTRTP